MRATSRVIMICSLAVASLVVAAAPAVAGIPSMVATPNPANVGALVSIANTPSGSHYGSCGYEDLDGEWEITLSITNPDGSVSNLSTLSDGNTGNWEIPFTPSVAGTYVINGSCGQVEGLESFDYDDLTLSVQGSGTTETAPTTVGTSTTTVATTAAVAAAATPTYTG